MVVVETKLNCIFQGVFKYVSMLNVEMKKMIKKPIAGNMPNMNE